MRRENGRNRALRHYYRGQFSRRPNMFVLVYQYEKNGRWTNRNGGERGGALDG